MLRIDVSFVVEFECHTCDQLVVDEYFDLDVLVGNFVGSETNQEGSGFICSIFMFNNDGIANPRKYSIFIKGPTHNLPSFHARFEKKHELLWKIDFYYKCSITQVYIKSNLIFLF